MLDQEMNTVNHDASPWPHALRNGIIWALIGIVIQLVMYSTGMFESMLAGEASMGVTILSGVISFAIAIFCVVQAIKAYRASRGGTISFGKSVGVGALTGLVYGLITAVWSFIFFNFIFSGYEAFMQDAMVAQWEAAGMDEDAIESAMGMSSMFTNPLFTALASIPTGAIYATIISLVAGLIMKTD